MNSDEATEILRALADRFQDKTKDKKTLFELHAALRALDCSYAVAAQAIQELIANPKAKLPTPHEIRAAVAKRGRPDKFVQCEARARILLEKIGRDFLSIKARRAAEPCQWCESAAVANGVDPNDSILFHEHFKLADYDADPALSVAVDMAMYGDWNRKPNQEPYHAIRSRYTRSPSPDDAEAMALANKRRFAILLESVSPAKATRKGRGMDAVNDLKNGGE